MEISRTPLLPAPTLVRAPGAAASRSEPARPPPPSLPRSIPCSRPREPPQVPQKRGVSFLPACSSVAQRRGSESGLVGTSATWCYILTQFAAFCHEK